MVLQVPYGKNYYNFDILKETVGDILDFIAYLWPPYPPPR